MVSGHGFLIFFHLDSNHRLWNFTRSALHIIGGTQRLIGIALVPRLCGARGLNRRSGISPYPED